MGAICCRADSPCGSAEERSGLLKDESTAKVPTGETFVVGTCGPESDDKDAMSKTRDEAEEKGEHVQHGHEKGEIEPNNTQENGPLQKEIIQTASPHRGPEHKEDSTRAQDEDIKAPSGDSGQAEHLQCTLNIPQTLHTATDWDFNTTTEVPKEENPASVQDRIPDGIFLTAGEVWPEKPSHTETTATRENITESTTHDNDEEAGSKVTNDNAAAEPSGEYLQKAPNTQLAAAACQVSSSSVVSQEISKEAPNTVLMECSNNGSSAESKQSSAEDLKSHNVPESPGSESAGLGQSGEELDLVNSVREPKTTAPADASESLKCSQDAKPDPERAAPSLEEVTSLENVKQDAGEETVLKVHDKDGDVSKASEDDVMKKEEANNTPSEAEIQDGLGKDGKDEQVIGNGDVKAEVVHVMEKEDAEDLGNSEEDLYRGAEELSTSQSNKSQPSPVSETTFLKVEDRCSLGPAVDILSYSEREWKGNTAKSALIRKGYKEMSQRFSSLRRVRGDNYCALRATLFQVLSHSTQLPAWLQEEDITMLPKQLEAQEGLISQWTFPGECLQESGTGDATQQLKGYMELLQNTWQAAVDCSSAVERQQLCERVFQGGEEELGLLEALKLLMLGRAVELHGCMQGSGDVPLFCWLLFARDSSDCPRSFLSNHISHVGLSAGLEQVEMFLLGYALQCTIQVYRLYKADTEEFVTYYPDDHKDEWPSVCLVTEDDRHYNVPVVEAAELHKDLNTS